MLTIIMCKHLFCREIQPWYSAEQIQSAAHMLNTLRYNNEFQEWFVPPYKRGQGHKDYSVLCGLAAEYLIDVFADIWNSTDTAVMLPKGRKKKSGTKFIQKTPLNYENKYTVICFNLLKNFS